MKALEVIGRSAFFVLMWLTASGDASGDSFTTNIIDGFGTNMMRPYILGDSGSFNLLIVTNSGALTNTAGILVNAAEAHNNSAILTGAGSYWSNSNGLNIGVTGSVNQVSVRDGAQLLVNGITYLGSNILSRSNRLEIAESNTTLDLGIIRVGHAGSDNEFLLMEGAKLTSSIVRVGYIADATRNRVRLSDPGTFASIRRFVIGESGPENLLEMSGGARLGIGVDGLLLGASNSSWGNTIQLSDSGTLLSAGPVFTIGSHGASNSVSIRDGARLNASYLYIGSNSVANALTVVQGQVQSWRIIIGRNSNALRNDLVMDGDHGQILSTRLWALTADIAAFTCATAHISKWKVLSMISLWGGPAAAMWCISMDQGLGFGSAKADPL